MPTESKSKRILVVDATVLSAIQSCPFYTYVTFVQHLRIAKAQEKFERGQLVHQVMERYYVCKLNGLNHKESVEEAKETGREYYTTLDGLELSEAEWIIQSSIQSLDKFELDGMKVLEVEKAFMIDLYEDDELIVKYSGKIDLYCELPIIGAIPLDHKSRERKTDEIILTNQYIGYAIAKQADVVYINEIGLQKTLKPDEKFRRIPVSYTEELKKHWVRNTIQWIKRLDWHLQENNWPEIWNPFKCKFCAVRGVCESGSMQEKERKLATQFHKGEAWDVTKVLEGEI